MTLARQGMSREKQIAIANHFNRELKQRIKEQEQKVKDELKLSEYRQNARRIEQADAIV